MAATYILKVERDILVEKRSSRNFITVPTEDRPHPSTLSPELHVFSLIQVPMDVNCSEREEFSLNPQEDLVRQSV